MSLKPLDDILGWKSQHICPGCGSESHDWSRFGTFTRKSDSKKVQRYRCRKCKELFSDSAFDLCWHQRKRQINSAVYSLLVSGVSQRRCARILRVNRKTIVRKFIFLGTLALDVLKIQNSLFPKAIEVQFDDLETIEHTKCKPLSVTLAVERNSRRILSFEIAQMPAKGLLARASVKKYGHRKDDRPAARRRFFKNLKEFAHSDCIFTSDDNPYYKPVLKKYFPSASHITFQSRKGSVTGQGELKKIGFDPLFSINHTFAKLRADINRLFRKTWCTTKSPERLYLHIAMMAIHHNSGLN